MPFIYCVIPAGKTAEQKAKFAEVVSDAVTKILKEEHNFVIFHELASPTGNVAADGKMIE
jgi:4-oxalocrotonate tautomerase family enzyme